MENIGDRIIELRKSIGLSQRQLAYMSGISQSGLSSIESNDKSPTIGTLALICKALDISLSTFLSSEKTIDDELSFELRQLVLEAKSLTPDKIKILTQSAKAMQ